MRPLSHALKPKGNGGPAPERSRKRPFCVQATALHATATSLHRLHGRKDGVVNDQHNPTSVGRATGKGLSECDSESIQHRWNLPLNGTWPDMHRSGIQVEIVTAYQSPRVAMDERNADEQPSRELGRSNGNEPDGNGSTTTGETE